MCLKVTIHKDGPQRPGYKVPGDLPAGLIPPRLPVREAWKIVCDNAPIHAAAGSPELGDVLGPEPLKNRPLIKALSARTTRTPYRGARWHPKINVATEDAPHDFRKPNRIYLQVGDDLTLALKGRDARRTRYLVGSVWADPAKGPAALERHRGLAIGGASINGGAIHLYTVEPGAEDLDQARDNGSRGYGNVRAVKVYYLPEDVLAYGTFGWQMRPNVCVVRCYGSAGAAIQARTAVDRAVAKAACRAIERLNRQMIDVPAPKKKPAPKKAKKRVNRSKASSKKGVRRK